MPLWSSGYYKRGSVVILKNDGVMVVYKKNRPLSMKITGGVCLGGLYVNPYRDYTATLQEYL